ncbi:hypothetical protein L596_024165 [Steinernema carpocapsae]|uniref:Uncharacterized protein n=1 Tax=Steinernema carpocapsae TaxID=34508 RepID=A0A4U5MFY5_STECR|nr:hypothetical protein L596_024165 [Steinernema carpocapsae]
MPSALLSAPGLRRDSVPLDASSSCLSSRLGQPASTTTPQIAASGPRFLSPALSRIGCSFAPPAAAARFLRFFVLFTMANPSTNYILQCACMKQF